MVEGSRAVLRHHWSLLIISSSDVLIICSSTVLQWNPTASHFVLPRWRAGQLAEGAEKGSTNLAHILNRPSLIPMAIIIITVTAVKMLFVTVQGIKSSCTIPPVEKGETAILTCKFDSDVKNLRHEFQVHRDCQSKSNPQETILFCGWNDENPDCHMYERITLDRKITDTFQVLIHNVTKDDEGTYECLKFPFSEEQEKTKDCFFSIKDPEMTSTKSDDVSTLDHQNPHVSNCNGHVITVNCLIGAVVGTFTLTSLISVSITRALLCLWYKHKLDLNSRISPRKDDQSQHTKLTLEPCESSAFGLSD